jgi:hypothetical protein
MKAGARDGRRSELLTLCVLGCVTGIANGLGLCVESFDGFMELRFGQQR